MPRLRLPASARLEQRPEAGLLRRRRPSARAWVPTGPGDARLAQIDLDGGQSSTNQRHLRRRGLAGWQAATTAGLLAALELSPRPGTFLDIGANAGVYSLLCKRLWPEMAVVAFEPFPATREAGRSWASANEEVGIRFEAIALSDHVGSAPMYVSARGDASNSLVEGFREALGAITVDVSTLDAYLERTRDVPSVLKIDVERHESAVLRGAASTLERHAPIIVIEMLQRNGEFTDEAREAHQLLDTLGYGARQLGKRDWLYWHGGVPTEFDDSSAAWRVAIDRCVPLAR